MSHSLPTRRLGRSGPALTTVGFGAGAIGGGEMLRLVEEGKVRWPGVAGAIGRTSAGSGPTSSA